MEQYIVSARKYRPSTFASVVGQQALASTLKNAIAAERLAHAYLFCGSRGVGKTSCARIFAKTINCSNRTPQGEACNECASCRQFNENRSLNIVELDAASNNGVDDIRELVQQVMVPPSVGRYRVFIIDEVHMLSNQAFNAFLKTLEEPPAHAIFILATTEKHKIIPTILSRCQIYDFNRITIADMVAHLEHVAASEGITAERAALQLIAGKADGAMRDALSIFDQVAASSQGNITYQSALDNLNVLDSAYYDRLFDAFIENDVTKALLIYKEVREHGFDSQFFINGLALYLRDVMVAANPATMCLLEAPDDVRKNMAERAAKVSPDFLYKAMALCNDADFNYRQASNKQFLVELTLIKLCQPCGPSPDDCGSDEGHLLPLEDFVRTSAVPQPAATAMPAAANAHTPGPTAPATQAAAPQAPKASPAAAPRAAHSSPYSLGGLSLNRRNQATRTEAATPAAAREHRSKPYTAADLTGAWRTLNSHFATQPMLQAILSAVEPEYKDAHTVGVTVGAQMQADIVLKAEADIKRLLADALANDDISLDVAVCQGEIPPAFWTDQQVLDHLLKENPGMAELMTKYKMRLS